MPDPETRDFSRLIAHHTVKHVQGERIDPPRSALRTARVYGGEIVTVDGVVDFRMGQWLAFTAVYDGWGEWTAVVHRDTCAPLPETGTSAPP